ncbi:hypothetical protein EPN44_10625 [bacterium]|nr:MAG: hypothetical protein EPN44_10625 [bacterium]
MTLWNIGSAPPLQALASLRASLRGHASLAIVRIALGFTAVLGGTLAVLEVVPSSDPDLVPISLIVFLAAILVEHLVGGEVRSRVPVLFNGRDRR